MQAIEQVKQQFTRGQNPVLNRDRHAQATDRYQVLRTDGVLDVFAAHGFEVARKRISGWINPANDGKQVHFFELRKHGEVPEVGGETFRIHLLNSHNRRTCLTIGGGIYRYWCANGAAVADDIIQPVKIKHLRGAKDKLNNAIYDLVAKHDDVMRYVETCKSIKLGTIDRVQFFDAATRLIFKGNMPETVGSFSPQRVQDFGCDLWTTYNRAQEYALRGGLSYTVLDRNNRPRAMTTRAVKSPARAFELNRQLANLCKVYADRAA